MFSSSYKIINPSSEKDQYNPGSQVDFYINHPNKAIVQESFYLSGKLYITSNNAVLDKADKIYYDNWAGAHNFVSDISTEFDGFSNKENASFLPRMEKMKTVVSESLESLSSDTKNTFELKCSKDIQTTQLAQGLSTVNRFQPFSFKPNFVLNRVPSNIPYSKTGMIRITVRLNEVSQALYGADYSTKAPNFYITNLKLNYRITDENPVVEPLVLPIVQVSKPTLQASQLNSVSVITPLPCSKMFCSFQSETSLNSPTDSKVLLSKPKDLKKITWYFNDSNNNFLTYSLDNDVEILKNGMLAVPGARPGHNSINWLNREQLYVMGMNFGEGVIPGNTKISLDIESETTLDKGTLFCYFMCFVEV